MDRLEEQLVALMNEDEGSFRAMPPLVPTFNANGPTTLSASAPAFVPKPHVVSIIHPVTYETHTMKCDLTTLSIGDLRLFATQMFKPASDDFNLLLSNQSITKDPSAKAIDLGFANGCVLVFQQQQQGSQMSAMQQMVNLMLLNTNINQSPTSGSSSSADGYTTPGTYTPMKGSGSQSTNGTFSPQLFTPEKNDHVGHAKEIDENYVHVMSLVMKDFVKMSRDPSASKLVLSMIEMAHPEHFLQLLYKGVANLMELVQSSSGADIIMALVALPHADHAGTLDPQGVPLIIEAMVPHIRELANMQTGRKLIQNVIVKYGEAQVLPLYKAVCANIVPIAIDQCGCITVQKMYDHCDSPVLEELLQDTICENVMYLICEAFGNYAVQHIIKTQNNNVSEKIVASLKGEITTCASNKYGSNVLESLLKIGTDNAKAALIQLISQPQSIELLVKDSYGNYVVQTATETAPSQQQFEELRRAIEPVICSSPYSVRIEAKLQKRLKRGFRPALDPLVEMY